MSKLPKPVSWGLRILLVVVIVFAAYNLIKDRSVDKVDQSATPTAGQTSSTAGSGASVTDRKGTFKGAGAYSVKGTASITGVDGKKVLVFDEAFSSTAGPDLKVYLSKNKVASGEDLGEFISLESLKGLSGAQTYTLPEDTDSYKSVVIWCRAFKTAFGSADLN